MQYGVYEQLAKSPDPEATAVLAALAKTPREPAAYAAILAAMERRRQRETGGLLGRFR